MRSDRCALRIPAIVERLEDRTLLSTFTVNSLDDAVDANPGDGVAADNLGNTTLRAALMEANARGGGDEIVLPAGNYTLSIPGTLENDAATGDLDIKVSLTISGAGPDVTTIDGNQLDRVFHVWGSGIVVSISGLTITGGVAPDDPSTTSSTVNEGGGILKESSGSLAIDDAVIRGNRSGAGRFGGRGGGIYSQSGTLTITNSTITQNVTGNATYALGSGGDGAGIASLLSNTTIVNSTISENRTGDGGTSLAPTGAGSGGGIHSQRGSLTILDSTVRDNITGVNRLGEGGGISFSIGSFESEPALVIESSTISGNLARSGGGISVGLGPVDQIIDSTISGNTAQGGEGGGIHLSGGTINLIARTTISGNEAISSSEFDGGGGIANQGTIGSIVNTTISGNTTNSAGGGIANYDNIGEIVNTTIAENSATDGGGVFHMLFANQTPSIGLLQNTIIADNTAERYNARDFRQLGSVTTATHNLVEDPHGHSLVGGINGNIVGIDPQLAPLADNGSATLTYALPAGSPAVDAGLNTGAPATDQRGLLRPVSATDLGAFERQAIEDSYVVNEDAMLLGAASVLANDGLSGGATVELVSDVFYGALSLSADGTFTYTPAPDFHGTDSFTYRAIDGATEHTAVATIVVAPVNDAPEAFDEVYAIDEDGRLVISTLTGGGDLVLRYGFDESPAGSSPAEDTGAISPPHAGTFAGQATRTGSTPGGATIGALDLTPGTNANNYVTAGDPDKIDALATMTVTAWINLRANPEHGDRIISDYIPIPSVERGIRAWEWMIEDPSGSTPATASNFRLAFTLYEINAAGTLSSRGFSAQNFNANAQWLFLAITVNSSGQAVMYSATETSEEMDIRLQGGGTFPAGGGKDNPVDLRIGGAGAAPDTDHTPPAWIDDVRIYDRALSAVELDDVRREALGNLATGGVLANDVDVDADRLTATLVSGPTNGTLALDPDGGFTYVPNPDFHGTDSFTYRAADGSAESELATVTIHVNSVIEVPVLTSPTAPVRINADSFTIEGTVEADTLVRVIADTDNDGQIDTSDTVVGSQQLSGGATAFSISVPLAQDAFHNFIVVASDAQGRISAPADVPPIIEDSIAPTADILNVIPDPRGTPVDSVTINFSEPIFGLDAAAFSLTRDGSPVSLTGLTVTQVSSSQYTIGLADFTADEGTYVLTLAAAGTGIADAAGNLLASDAADAWETDHTLRLTVEISAGSIFENRGSGAATGTVRRSAAGDLGSPLTVWLSVSDGSEAAVPPFVVIPAGETFATFPIDPVNDGQLDGDQPVTITATADLPGSLAADATYGSNGIGSAPLAMEDAVLQPDGKLVVAGFASPGSHNDIVVARFNADGTPDTSFGPAGTGLFTMDIQARTNNAFAVDLQSDGRIIVGGEMFLSGGSTQFDRPGFLIRLDTDGLLDTTFGTNGVVINDRTSLGDEFRDLIVLPDDSILAVGSYQSNSGALYHFDRAGKPLTFSSGSEIFFTGLSGGAGPAIVRQPDGKIVVTAFARPFGTNTRQFGVVRLTAELEFDTTFGTNGVVMTDWTPNDEWPEGVTVQPDGRIIVVGRVGPNLDFSHAIVRYNVDGTLDASFGDDGIVATTHPVRAIAYAVQTLPDGSILVAGSGGSSSNGVLSRYSAAGALMETRLLNSSLGTSIVIEPDGDVLVAAQSGQSGTVQRYAPVHFMIGAASLTVLDDVPGFTITETGPGTTVSENSTADRPIHELDTFTVVLTGPPDPGSQVVLNVASSQTGEATVSPAQLTFDSSNWDQPQTVAVQGVNDNAATGDSEVIVTVSVNDSLTTDDDFDALADQTVTVDVLDVPVTPQMTAPLTGTVVQEGQVTFTWTQDGVADTYNLWLIDRAAPQAVLYSRFDIPAGTSFPLPENVLDPGDYRYWFSANNANGFSNWSGPHDFSVGAAATIPDPPSGFSTSDSGDPQQPGIHWDSAGVGATYNIWLINLETGALVASASGLATNSFTPSSDLDTARHRIWVQARNAAGTSAWSAPFDFDIGEALSVPAAPATFGKTQNANARQPTINWNAVAGAETYRIWLINLETGALVSSASGLTDNSFTPSINLAETRHRIWVQATNLAGTSPWSAPFDFDVGGTVVAPEKPAWLSVMGANTPRPTIQWDAPDGATHYAIWFVDLTENEVLSSATNLTEATFTPAEDLAVGDYRFYVRAINAAGTSGWAGPLDFKLHSFGGGSLMALSGDGTADGDSSDGSAEGSGGHVASQSTVAGSAGVFVTRDVEASLAETGSTETDADEELAQAASLAAALVPQSASGGSNDDSQASETAAAEAPLATTSALEHEALAVSLLDEIFAADAWLDSLAAL